MHRGGLSRAVLSRMLGAAAIAASTNGALQRISTGQMEKAPIMSLEIILRKSESLPKIWGLDGAAIGKAS